MRSIGDAGMDAVPFLPVVVIAGATAVGKTGLAITLAKAINGEIVGADSRQIYRFMDIGTAKPTAEQRAQIPHHLIDVVNPDETMSLTQYQTLARIAIDDILVRGKIPLLVGGTGQYITAIMQGWSAPSVPPNDTLRAELETVANKQGLNTLVERLRAVDPVGAQTIDIRNPRRVIRALEVTLISGKPFSAQQLKNPPPYTFLHYVLTMDRAALYERADRRVDVMIADGFLEEVRQLLNMGYSPTLPSMSGLGYSQLANVVLNGGSLDAAVTAIYSATHDFIRRQYTWFRKYNANAEWLDMAALNIDTLIQSVRQRIT